MLSVSSIKAGNDGRSMPDLFCLVKIPLCRTGDQHAESEWPYFMEVMVMIYYTTPLVFTGCKSPQGFKLELFFSF